MNILNKYVFVNKFGLFCSFCRETLFSGSTYELYTHVILSRALTFHILDFHSNNDFIEKRIIHSDSLWFRFNSGYFGYFYNITSNNPQLLFVMPTNISELVLSYRNVEITCDVGTSVGHVDALDVFHATVDDLNFACTICKFAYDCGFPTLDTVCDHLEKGCAKRWTAE